ncbi:MAG: selenide,water dikinase [Planctomycetota bacterium]|jgi:selenide,water dikinase
MPMGQLTQVLRGISNDSSDRLLVGPQTIDDAGVVLLDERDGAAPGSRIALVQTVDYFPPVLDDPYLYGAVAAANALSDVYAMGGRPISALNLAGFPKDFSEEWVREIFRGGFEKVREAGAVIAGGHTVQGEEPMFGFAITGVVDPDKIAANAGAQVGDQLYLTKALGMGTMITAGKRQVIPLDQVKPAAIQMATLNDRAADAMNAVGANACTDITGFGLVGHSHNIAKASNVTIRFQASSLPIFPGARELAAEGIMSGGSERGRATLGADTLIGAGVEAAIAGIVFDAETSGGLLISVPADRASDLEAELGKRDVPIDHVGEVLARGEHVIEIV